MKNIPLSVALSIFMLFSVLSVLRIPEDFNSVDTCSPDSTRNVGPLGDSPEIIID